MKRLIENNFLYYSKSFTKIFLSIAFILSFISVIFVYDNLELNQIRKEAGSLRLQSTGVNTGDISEDYIKMNNIDFSDFELREKLNYFLYSDFEWYTGERFHLTDDEIKLFTPLKELRELETQTGILKNGLSSLHEGGRMNIELTSFRSEISKKYADIADYIGWNSVAKNMENGNFTGTYLKADHNRSAHV